MGQTLEDEGRRVEDEGQSIEKIYFLLERRILVVA